MSSRLKAIYDEIEKLSHQDEDPDKYIGFIHPDTVAELRHPSSEGRMLNGSLFVAGLEVRPNELVQRGQVILIPKEHVYDDPPPPSQEVV